MKHMTFRERRYRRAHLDCVRHITLDPKGPGVVRIHMIPPRDDTPDAPFLLLLNGAQLVPLNLSWAIMLANLMDQLQAYEGQDLAEDQWEALLSAAVEETHRTYPRTKRQTLASDLHLMLTSLVAIAQGREPEAEVGLLSLSDYAPEMTAPHRMDLMVSAMEQNGAWHCNQKCLHCYAAGQPMGETPELSTEQWKTALALLRKANIPQVTFTGGEPTLRHDLVKLVQAAQWFVTRLNTNGRMLTSAMCKELRAASLDAVQITFYSADEAVHNELVGVDGYTDTVNGIKNALAAGLNVSLNTPLCSLNKNYLSTVQFAHELGIRYLTCSGLIPAGNANADASRSVRLTPAELTDALRPAMDFALSHGMEVNFTSPGWLDEDTLTGLGFTQIPSCGACLSNMAVAPDGTVLPCQSWLTGHGLGNMLRTPWPRIWRSPECCAIRIESAHMKRLCQLGDTPMQEGC